MAAAAGDVAAIRRLLDSPHGGGLEATDSGGETALIVAAHTSNIGVVRLLLAAGADPNAREAVCRRTPTPPPPPPPLQPHINLPKQPSHCLKS